MLIVAIPCKTYIMAKDRNDKTVMGKDRDGTFHPGKGKPSGINKDEGLGIQPTDPERMEEYLELTDKYTAGEDILADHVPVRHPNRNTSKGEDTFKAKENTEESNKSNNQTFTEERSTTVPEQLPGVFSKETFTELANFKDGITVSLYFPTHRAGVEVNEHFDHIAFKSTLNTVEQKLKEKGYNQAQIEPLLKPGYDLIREDGFWNDLSEGLAVFIAEGVFKYVKMPVAPEQQIVIESTFYVTPLVPIMTSSEYFYVLTISKKTIKLFKGDAFGMQIVPVELPQGIEEVKRLSDLDATTYRQGESGRRAPSAAIAGQSHGAGGGNPEDKDNIATYFEAVDDILWEKIFHNENAPLVLAGVEYEIPIYKSVCDYNNVWEKSLTGNREYQDTASLYNDAKEIMQPYFDQRKTKALEMYGNKSATELTSSIINDVIPATYYGRVSHLFVAKGEHVWGTFDEMANEIKIHEKAEGESEDLIDNAVVKTLATGGEVFLLEKEQMPAESPVAALMRY
jgi:hypothetical protein